MGPFLRLLPAVLCFSLTPLACAGAKPPPTAASAAAPAPEAAAPAPSKPAERPFAKTPLEATTLIDDAIEMRRDGVIKCVEAARSRRGDKRARVEFDLGIDQEGTVIGVKTPKGTKDDSALNECIRETLKGAPFPRSTSGVITVRKGFSDELVYPK